MNIRTAVSAFLVCTFGVSVAGCAFFPRSGPLSDVVEFGAAEKMSDAAFAHLNYYLAPVTPHVVEVLEANEPRGLAGVFRDRRPPANLTFGVGDVVSVTIFEAAAGGLFIPSEAGVRPGNFVTLPEQAVDNDGNISIPYAGLIKAAGRTNVDVQNEVIARIKNRAIEPQVVVALASQRTSLISVMGEVNTPVRFAAAASGAGDRITDALTRAGGIRGQGFETWVVLERGGKRGTVPFENLIMNPANNIYVQPGDRIYVYREQQKFIAFGASGQQGEFNFDAWRINLAEAVAKAGGITDTQGHPGSVFVYRREPREVAAALGADLNKYPGASVPVVFRMNMDDPAGYFLATKIMMRNGDVVFAANAREVDVSKVIGFLNLIVGSSANGAIAINNAYATKALLK